MKKGRGDGGGGETIQLPTNCHCCRPEKKIEIKRSYQRILKINNYGTDNDQTICIYKGGVRGFVRGRGSGKGELLEWAKLCWTG